MRDARFAPENAHRNHQHHSLSLSPLFARQIELEKEMADRGRDRYYTTVARNTERNAEANTSYGKMLLKRGIEPMARAISEFMESAKQGGAGRRHKAVGMLEGMDVQVVAFIALRKVLDTFSQSMPYQRVSILVGREVEMEKKLTELKEQDPDRYRMTQRYIAGSKARKYRRTVLNYAFGKSTTVEYEPWAEADCLHLGQKLIELAMESCGIFHLVQVPSQTTWTYARHNAVNDYAKKNGIPFLDLDLKRKEIGFSWKTDSQDAGNHLNCYGAKKVSLYVGQYIKNHVQLEDKRQNAAYAGWNDDYTTYIKHLKEGGDVEKRKGPTAGQNNNPVPNDRPKKEQPHTGDPYNPSVQAVSKQ